MSVNLSALKRVEEDAQKYGASWVAVTKYRTEEEVQALYGLGLRTFGENKVQDLLAKKKAFPKDVAWHLIGHLQSNKVKQVAGQVALIQSVDSLNLVELLEKECEKSGVIQPILIQLKIAREESKYGWEPKAGLDFFYTYQAKDFPHLTIKGLMGMATNTDNQEEIAREYGLLHAFFEQINRETSWKLDTLSMGMSQDYQIALEQGATLLRIGSLLFTN